MAIDFLASRSSHRYERVEDLLQAGELSISFEFSPPRTEQGRETLWQTIESIEKTSPAFVSVTYGAGGTVADRLDRTVEVMRRIASETSMATVGHLTCVGASESEIRDVIAAYRAAGIRNLLALRGDPADGPAGVWQSHPGGLNYAVELVELLAQEGDLGIGVAAFPYRHPASPDLDHDARILAMKAKAGASYAITQLFYEIEAYQSLVDRASKHGCTIPIIPGLMPITSLSQIRRFTELNGTAVPEQLVNRLEMASDPAEVRRIGIEQTTELANKLLEIGAPGLHFYTLNRSTATLEIWQNLGLAAAKSTL